MRKVRLEDFSQLSAAYGFGKGTDQRVCDHPDCSEPAEHRAPKSRKQLEEYFWFCRVHVEQYNRSWNYYEGLDESEIERQIVYDSMWNRPTWPLGHRGFASAGQFGTIDDGFEDTFKFFAEEKRARAEARRERRESGDCRYNGSPERKALRILQLDDSADMKTVKARYKELVKKYHPDANGGNLAAEDELKRINEAYNALKRSALARAR